MVRARGFVDFMNRHFFGLTVFVAVFIFIFASFGLVIVNGEEVKPTDTHIITFQADGQEGAIPTRAATVGEFINSQTNVSVGAADIVEPSRDAVITGDNFEIKVHRAVPTTIVDGNVATTVLSAYEDPRQSVIKAGYELFEEDLVKEEYPGVPSVSRILGRKISITRSKLLAMTVYGTPTNHRTVKNTVREVLKDMNVVLEKGDTVSPSLDTLVADTNYIHISRPGVSVVNVEELIEPSVETIYDSSLAFGTSSVTQPGAPGKRLVTYELTLENGKEVSRRKIQETVVSQPVKRVVSRGQNVVVPEDKKPLLAAAGIAESDFGYVDYIIGREGSWCPTKWQGQWGICPSHYEEMYPGAETDTSRGYGICQSTPAIKMATSGLDWRTNIVTQLKWCNGYAMGRYGSWRAAYEFWLAKHWW